MRSLIVLLLLAHAGTATAHHAFAADYEAGNEGVIEGTITEVIYKNPHARYYIEVETGEGGTELWDLQTMNLMMLGRVSLSILANSCSASEHDHQENERRFLLHNAKHLTRCRYSQFGHHLPH